MSRKKLILDSDPGTDDVLAFLLVLACSEFVDLELISLTFGNTSVDACLRNTVTCFHVLEKENLWREKMAIKPRKSFKKPIVARGAGQPLQDTHHILDYFHGNDGLGGSTEKAPEFTPTDPWDQHFAWEDSDEIKDNSDDRQRLTGIITSRQPSHREILRVLAENAPDTVTLCCIGPMTNIALAAEEDVETLARAKEIIVMGGNIDVAGNVSPCAEFNTWCDPVAAALVYSLSSAQPESTFPPDRPVLRPSRRLNITLFPLDITTHHLLYESAFRRASAELETQGSPLVRWIRSFLEEVFDKTKERKNDVEGCLSMHDPLAAWYAMTSDDPLWEVVNNVDLRVETAGQWTKGACIVDKRGRPKVHSRSAADEGGWLTEGLGNKIRVVFATPGDADPSQNFVKEFLRRLFTC